MAGGLVWAAAESVLAVAGKVACTSLVAYFGSSLCGVVSAKAVERCSDGG